MDLELNNNLNSYLSFKLGEETFAANVSKVLEILELSKITKVPKSPDYLRGVINLRGSVLPVIDTRIKFNLPVTPDTVNTCIIVLNLLMEDEEINVGALVDSVQEVLELDEGDIKPPPKIGSKFKSDFIHGMTKIDEDFVMILDINRVFTTDEIVDLKEINTEEAASV